ncbi:MAG: ATP-binding protein [Lachnospiraceae bacterium]|nr:ATP-binding protein [Lachnospiraceae bacterium]
MKYNISFSIAALFVFAVEYAFLRIHYKDENLTARRASRVLICIILADIFDFITAITISYPYSIPVWANYGLNIVYYELEIFGSVMLPIYIRYVLNEENDKLKPIDYLNRVIYAIYALAVLSTPITHAFFFFDENRVYTLGNVHIIESLLPVYFLLFTFAKLTIKRKRFSKYQYISIVIFTVVLLAATLGAQFIAPRVLFFYFAVSIAAFILMTGIETPDYKKLQMVLNELEENRKVLEISQKREEASNKAVREMTKSSSWALYLDKDMNVINGDWSDEFFWMLGYDKNEEEDRLYSLWTDSLHPDERDEMTGAFMAGMSEKGFDRTYRLRNKNGEYHWYHGSGELKPDVVGDGFIYHGIIRDVNDEVIKQELLEKAEAADRAKTDFLANMSHEIRTPINAVLGMNELISRESTEPAIQGYSADVAQAGRALLSLINDILDFSKIEAGRMELAPAEYEVLGLLGEAYHMVNIRCVDRGLKLFVKNNPNIPSKLYGDEVRIRQVLVNILTNAVKYTDEGSVTLDMDYESVSDSQINLIVRVSDTGIGIKEEDLDKIFDSFKRIDFAHNRTREGTGLGLSITQSFVEMMGGTIKVESVYTKGSTFTVSIPQEVRSREIAGEFKTEEVSKKKKYEASFTAPEAVVLAVDDVATNLAVIKGLLKQTSIEIDTASSGAACLEAVQKKEYDMIFLDHMMPGVDGIETLKKMEEIEHLNKGKPIVMLTANAIIGVKEEYLGMGFTDYLSKPIRAEELEGMIIKYLPKEKVILKNE